MSRVRNRPSKTPAVQPTVNPYGSVIDVLMAGKYNAVAMVGLLAKEHPELFLTLHAKTTESQPLASWMNDVVSMTLANERVSAIKKLREHTGFGLKEAKDVCDHFGDRLFKRTTGLSLAALTKGQTDILNNLLKAAQRGITVTF